MASAFWPKAESLRVKAKSFELAPLSPAQMWAAGVAVVVALLFSVAELITALTATGRALAIGWAVLSVVSGVIGFWLLVGAVCNRCGFAAHWPSDATRRVADPKTCTLEGDSAEAWLASRGASLERKRPPGRKEGGVFRAALTVSLALTLSAPVSAAVSVIYRGSGGTTTNNTYKYSFLNITLPAPRGGPPITVTGPLISIFGQAAATDCLAYYVELDELAEDEVQLAQRLPPNAVRGRAPKCGSKNPPTVRQLIRALKRSR